MSLLKAGRPIAKKEKAIRSLQHIHIQTTILRYVPSFVMTSFDKIKNVIFYKRPDSISYFFK